MPPLPLHFWPAGCILSGVMTRNALESAGLSLHQAGASCYVPDELALPEALARATHVGIGAHPDDLELMALPGILACRESSENWFTGIVCTHGGSATRAGAETRKRRRHEQEAAARAGGYGLLIQLDYSSAAIRGADRPHLEEDLARLLERMHPATVYLHHPADRHDTHVAVSAASIRALRALPADRRPASVVGAEVWGSLDWLPAGARAELDVSGEEAVSDELIQLFESQIAGGKRYDLAASGRRRANATFRDPYAPDQASEIILAMDLSPLMRDPALPIEDFLAGQLDRFREEILARLRRMTTDAGKT